MIPYVIRKRDANKNVLSKKIMSHGTFRCKRHPNSKRCKMDDWKEWIITIILLPVFIFGFAVLYIIMIATVLMAMFIEWYNNVPLPRSKK